MRRAIALIVIVVALALPTVPVEAADKTQKVKSEIRRVFGKHASKALRVAYCESRYNPRAVSRTLDVGVFQINWRWHRRPGESFASFKRRMFDINANVRKAHRLSRGGTSWKAWVCQP